MTSSSEQVSVLVVLVLCAIVTGGTKELERPGGRHHRDNPGQGQLGHQQDNPGQEQLGNKVSGNFDTLGISSIGWTLWNEQESLKVSKSVLTKFLKLP